MSQGCCISNIRVFKMPVYEKKIFLNFTKFYPFLPLIWAPIGASPLIFVNLNPHSPKMLPTKVGSNQFSGFGEV